MKNKTSSSVGGSPSKQTPPAAPEAVVVTETRTHQGSTKPKEVIA